MFQVETKRPSLTIAAFTHGAINRKKKKKIKFKSYKKIGEKKRFLVGQTDSCCYVGKNFEDMFDSSKMCNHYIGVFNKSTGKIQICDADVFHLNPNFKEPERKTEEKQDLTKFEKKSRLIEAFGGQKSKQIVENQTRNVVEKEVLKEAIDGALKESMKTGNSGTIDWQEKVVNNPSSELLPPCNPQATVVEDVYKLEDILNSADMIRLSDHSQEMMNIKPEEISELSRQEKYCHFVIEHLASLSSDPIERQKSANCLLYYQYLVQLHLLKAQQLRSKDYLSLFPDFIRKKFLISSFITETKNYVGRFERKMSSYQKDKIAVYIIVLSLILDDFKTSVSTIIQDLKIGRAKALKLFGYVGCKLTQERGLNEMKKSCAILQVPLVLKMVAPKKNRKS